METSEDKIKYLKSIFDLEDDIIHEVLVSTEFCVDKAIDELLTLTANQSVFIEKYQPPEEQELQEENNVEIQPNEDVNNENQEEVINEEHNDEKNIEEVENNDGNKDENENVDERNDEGNIEEVKNNDKEDKEIPLELENEIRARDKVWNATKKLFTYFLPGGDKHEEVGEKIYVVRTNEFGIRHLREIYLTDSFIIRVDPKTRERKEVRSYNDIKKIVKQEKKITIHYIDGNDYLTLTESGIETFQKVLLNKRPEIEFVNHQ